MTYENRKTGWRGEITMTRKGRVYLKGKGGSTRTVAQTNLIKSYKKVPKVEPRPSSVAETFARTSKPGPPPKPVGPLHEAPDDTDRFTYITLALGAIVIVAIIVAWALTR